MPFDLIEWKRQFSKRLSNWRARLDGDRPVYPFLSAAALWPVADAARRGDWAAIGQLAALTVSSLGTTLLANQVQTWQDEADAAQQLERAAADPALRAELEAVLAKLDAFALAEGALDAADRPWFVETIQRELRSPGGSTEAGAPITQKAGKDSVQFGQVNGDVNLQVNYGAAGGSNPLPLPEALPLYLDHLIATHQHLKLQGIRAGSQPLSVALEKVYVSLTALDRQAAQARPAARQNRSPLEADQADRSEWGGNTGELTIAAALGRYRRLVVIGDPGCGKTTLLAYLALTYARARRDGGQTVQQRLGLNENDTLPILLPLRDLGRHLKEQHPDPGQDGPALLLNYLHAYFQAQKIELPPDFFDPPLAEGKAVLLLDGMDEVAENALRQRTARLIEKFAARYPKCRFVVTSREVGYEGAARIGAEFGLARVRQFSPAEVRQFVRDWTIVVETSLAGGETEATLRLAEEQAGRLIAAIERNARVAELAVNPLLLTVIALVHRYRAQLPERRSELYEEAVEVLLGLWDEAKGLQAEMPLGGRLLDGGDRRSLLEPIAFWLHERKRREIERDELIPLLQPAFANFVEGDKKAAQKAVMLFLQKINERSGLLVERGVGVYGFAHLTFQEYLAARALADRADAVEYSVKVLPDPWWREVILLQAGYLSTQGKRRVSELICAILEADGATEPEPFHHLLLAAECLFDVGPARVEGDLLGEARRRLQTQADLPIQKGDKPGLLRKVTALNALARLKSGQVVSQYWKKPWGEPEWVTIPAGEFWMGSSDAQIQMARKAGASDWIKNEQPQHRLYVAEFQIARIPTTNAQYALFVADSGHEAPKDWRGGEVPQGKENHPVVNVSWQDALAYCRWLSGKIGREVILPGEAEWEKAARGGGDRRDYPWGEWAELCSNTDELGLDDTTPVGLFLNGASPYGVLDMSGNVWEWTRSTFESYPYQPGDGREDLQGDRARVLRGGSFDYVSWNARSSYRYYYVNPGGRGRNVGFRCCLAPCR